MICSHFGGRFGSCMINIALGVESWCDWQAASQTYLKVSFIHIRTTRLWSHNIMKMCQRINFARSQDDVACEASGCGSQPTLNFRCPY